MTKEIKPRITSMRFFTSNPTRPTPMTGDRKHTKSRGTLIRVPVIHNVMRVVNSRGKQIFDWRTPEQIYGTRYEHLLTPEECAQFEQKFGRRLGYMQMRGAA